ncbi:hypothetical protein NQZ68_007948 [Dissostichus eleginoides]|nr:hypothetical protein NQZ68_007948 [Dissostichus eleginoides]
MSGFDWTDFGGGISDKMGGVPRDQGRSHAGAIKVSGAGATEFTRSCVFPGVALGLRVLDLTVEVPAPHPTRPALHSSDGGSTFKRCSSITRKATGPRPQLPPALSTGLKPLHKRPLIEQSDNCIVLATFKLLKPTPSKTLMPEWGPLCLCWGGGSCDSGEQASEHLFV